MTDSGEWVELDQRDHSVAVNRDESKLRWRDTKYVHQDLVDQVMEKMRSAQRARDSISDQCDDLESRVEVLTQKVEEQNQVIAKYDNQNRRLKSDFEESVKLSEQRQDAFEELQVERDDLAEEVERMTDVNAELSQQIEEMSLSPLTLEQQQRAKALTLAREVVEETGTSSILTKSGGKASLAGLVTTANYIVSGARDYVVTEGEFIERHTAALPTIETDAGTIQVKGGDSE